MNLKNYTYFTFVATLLTTTTDDNPKNDVKNRVK